MKISYRTTQNLQQIISAHNRKLLNQQTSKQVKTCTRRANTCPVQGKCQEEGTIYQATVKHQSPDTGQEIRKTYIALAATSFYKRHQNHKSTFNHRTHETKSELSKYIWYLKDKGINYEINWKIIDRAKKLTPISKNLLPMYSTKILLNLQKRHFYPQQEHGVWWRMSAQKILKTLHCIMKLIYPLSPKYLWKDEVINMFWVLYSDQQ